MADETLERMFDRLRRLPPAEQEAVLDLLAPAERARAARRLADAVAPSPHSADIAARIADPALSPAVRDALARIVRSRTPPTNPADPSAPRASLLDRIVARRGRG